MAVLILRASVGQHLCPRPCWACPTSPGQGSRRVHQPSEGHSAQLQLQPHPLNRQTPWTPSHHPGMPLVMAAAVVPHPSVPLAGPVCGGPVLIAQSTIYKGWQVLMFWPLLRPEG